LIVSVFDSVSLDCCIETSPPSKQGKPLVAC
jgi:hypothetical protein